MLFYTWGMSRPAAALNMSEGQREILGGLAASRTAAHREVQRARVLLLAADGVANARIADEVGVTPVTVRAWRAQPPRGATAAQGFFFSFLSFLSSPDLLGRFVLFLVAAHLEAATTVNVEGGRLCASLCTPFLRFGLAYTNRWCPLVKAALLLSVFFGMQSIPCSTPRRRKRAAPYNRNTPRKAK